MIPKTQKKGKKTPKLEFGSSTMKRMSNSINFKIYVSPPLFFELSKLTTKLFSDLRIPNYSTKFDVT
jgi:hypothetical protein